jgi:phosphoribosylanthranilate isomerase
MKLKICGMCEPQNIKDIANLCPNYLGLIFYEKSPRFVDNLPAEILQELPINIEKVGVFVNETEEKILQITNQYAIETLQLHGTESPEFCKQLRQQGFTIFKAFNIGKQEDIEAIDLYKNCIDLAVLDAKGKQLGGNGTSFDWALLDNYIYDIPFLLSGGISLDNISAVLALKHPKLYPIDINSKFEISAGFKDVAMVEKLLLEFRK